MARYRPARSRASSFIEDVIRKSHQATRLLAATGYKPDAFVLPQRPLSANQMRTVLSQHFRNRTPPVRSASQADAVARLPPGKADPSLRHGPNIWESTKAGFRGIADSLPFEGGNVLPAAVWAAGAALSGSSPGQAFYRRLSAERGQDRYDEAMHPTARSVGKWTGTAAQMALLPAEGIFVKGGARLAEAAPMLAREWGVVGATGGGISAASRGMSDYLHGERSSAAEYAGDFVGGGADALLSRFGYGGAAGAAGGATASVATDVLDGRAPSIEHMRQAAVAGADSGILAGAAGRSWSNSLRPRQKGDLGERLSLARTLIGGDLPRFGPKRAVYPRGRKTIPDHATIRRMLVEAKFGPSAHLSRNQRVAYEFYGPGYRVDSFLPRDVGAIAAFPAAMIGAQIEQRHTKPLP